MGPRKDGQVRGYHENWAETLALKKKESFISGPWALGCEPEHNVSGHWGFMVIGSRKKLHSYNGFTGQRISPGLSDNRAAAKVIVPSLDQQRVQGTFLYSWDISFKLSISLFMKLS